MVKICTSQLALPCMYEGRALELPLFFAIVRHWVLPGDNPKKLWDPILGQDDELFPWVTVHSDLYDISGRDSDIKTPLEYSVHTILCACILEKASKDSNKFR